MKFGLVQTFCSFLIVQTQMETVGTTLICTSKKPRKSSGMKTDGLHLKRNLEHIKTEMHPDDKRAG